jgi:RNA polymerase sigma-70 factor (ECF subfamily)
MNEEPHEFIPTRASLLSRLKNWDDQDSWKDFFDTYWKLIYAVAIKSGLSDAEAQDVVQDTVISVAKKMQEFKYDPAMGTFKGWLLQLTRWRILNQLKKRLPRNAAQTGSDDGGTGTSTLDRLPDPSALDLTAYWNEEWEKNLIDTAIERVKTQTSARQYEIFYLHVVKKFSAPEVAETLNVSRAQVYLAKLRVSALVKKIVRKLEKESL